MSGGGCVWLERDSPYPERCGFVGVERCGVGVHGFNLTINGKEDGLLKAFGNVL